MILIQNGRRFITHSPTISSQRDEFKIRIEKLQVVQSVNYKSYVDKVFSLVQEAAEKKKHYLILLLQK